MTDNEKRIARERSIVRGVIRALKAAHWLPHSVYDGGDEDREVTSTETAMMDVATGVDTANLWFAHKDAPKRCCVVVVFGNGDDVIADHSAPDPDPHGFAAAIDSAMRAKHLI